MKKILVIEDDGDIRDNLIDLLTQEGFFVIAAKNGKEGIDSAVKEIPDLIISDVMMPEADGFEVKEALNINPFTATIPFLFLTAKASKENRRYGFKIGADDYLTKPFTRTEILEAVKTRLKRKELFDKKYQDLKKSIALSVPHELLTPLTAVLGYAALLKESENDLTKDETQEMLDGIINGGERLRKLVTRFLFYAKLEMISKDREVINSMRNNITKSPSEIINSITNEYAVNNERGEDISITQQDSSIKITEDHFKILIEEVIDNAFKFSKKGKKILVHSVRDGNKFVILIQNEGRGMTVDQIANIGAMLQFDRQKYEQQGGGLGLAIAKKIVDLYDGRIEIKSEHGKEISVLISLPVREFNK